MVGSDGDVLEVRLGVGMVEVGVDWVAILTRAGARAEITGNCGRLWAA